MSVPVRRLGDRYEVGPLLGYGGMAEVHHGSDMRLGRDVAVKTLRTDLARDPAFQGRFRREAQSAASLNHPAIVAVYDTGEEQDAGGTAVPYIVMEYIEGRTLRDELATGGRLLPQRALEITAEICAALDYSHQHGIVHRDIKPGNVMLTPGGAVKVMDFGIARAVTASQATMTQTAAVIGTAQYLSPEQARGEAVDARSDIYSTGCLLYELLTGRAPFLGESPVSVAYQHVREDPVPPSRLDPELPPEVDAIVLKAMAKNRANRYQSAADMRADIERALAGQPVLATPVLSELPTMRLRTAGSVETAVLPPVRRDRRGRGLAFLLLALALLALGTAGYLLLRGAGGHQATIDVPNVVGQTQAQAEQALRARGLAVGQISRHSNPERAGLVFAQNPKAGQGLAKGDPVALFVSTGPALVQVPALVGTSQLQASQTLQQVGLVPGMFLPRNSSQPAGRVLSSVPPAGQQVPVGSKVTLIVSSGSLTLPDVRGKTQSEAVGLLGGFNVSFRYVDDASDPPGTVIDQSPGPGSAAAGSTVTLTVAQKPAASPSPSPAPTTPPASPSPSPPAPSAPPSPSLPPSPTP